MYIGALFDVLDLSVAALASMCVALVLAELGARWAFLVYAVAAVLSFLLLPVKTPAILFSGFLGFYPITKSVFERRLHGVWQWIAKASPFKRLYWRNAARPASFRRLRRLV